MMHRTIDAVGPLTAARTEREPAVESLTRRSALATAATHERNTNSGPAQADGLPLWLRSGISLCYAAVGAAHLIVGALIGAGEKPLVLAAVLVLLLVNLYCLDVGRGRLTAWWQRRHGKHHEPEKR